MTRYLTIALLGVSLVGAPLLTGCDDKKEESKSDVTVKHEDGSKTVEKEKTKLDPKTGDSSISIEKKVTGPTTNPSNP